MFSKHTRSRSTVIGVYWPLVDCVVVKTVLLNTSGTDDVIIFMDNTKGYLLCFIVLLL